MGKLTHTTGLIFFAGLMAAAPPVFAGATFEIDKVKWISIGAGAKTSFAVQGERSGDEKMSEANDFRLDNMRLYVNGQIHESLKIEFNTDCTNCADGGTMIILDAIGKLEFNQYFNVWAGRLLVPADRAELDGPYFQNTFDFNKTPFYPSDHGNFVAGRFGRDDGLNVWGALFEDKRLTYVAGVFDGVDSGKLNRPNTRDNLLWAGRVSYNFWNVEQNPGYYTSSTYYGGQGDILTLALAGQYHKDGVGTATNQSDFRGYSADLLMEKVLPNKGVLTLEGEYKVFETGLNEDALKGNIRDDAGVIAETGTDCFCLFDGNSWTATALYLFPEKSGIGQWQPYVRFTETRPSHSTYRNEFEIGTNYIIDGHNARVSLFYQYGDIATKGRAWRGHESGDEVGTVKLALQWQI